MNRKLSIGMVLFLALSVGLVCGFFAGRKEGSKPGQVHKALSAALRQEQKGLRRSIEELEQNNSELEAQLSIARFDSAQCQERFDDCQRMQQSENFVGPVFPEFAPFEDGEIPASQRITELECDVATLKELVHRDRPPGEVGADSVPATRTKMVKAAEVAVGKEQCAAITKKGVRCSRNAKSDGKCWQHGG